MTINPSRNHSHEGQAKINLDKLFILNSIRKKTLQIINSLNFSYKFC